MPVPTNPEWSEDSAEDSQATESDSEMDTRLRCPPITESPEASSPSDSESEVDTMALVDLVKLKSQSTGKRAAPASSSTKKVTKKMRGAGKKTKYKGPCTCHGQCGKLVSGTSTFACRKREDGTSTCAGFVTTYQGQRLCAACYRAKCRLTQKLTAMKKRALL